MIKLVQSAAEPKASLQSFTSIDEMETEDLNKTCSHCPLAGCPLAACAEIDQHMKKCAEKLVVMKFKETEVVHESRPTASSSRRAENQ